MHKLIKIFVEKSLYACPWKGCYFACPILIHTPGRYVQYLQVYCIFSLFYCLLTAGTIPEHKELCITDRVTGIYMTKSTKNATRRKVTRRRHRFGFRSSSLSSLITDLYKHEERKYQNLIIFFGIKYLNNEFLLATLDKQCPLFCFFILPAYLFVVYLIIL